MSDFWESVLENKALSEGERAIRERFVEEYLKDYDPFLACRRVGMKPALAAERSVAYLNDVFVLRAIKDRELTSPENGDRQAEQDKNLVMSVLRQAAQTGPENTRVQAASKLATILGIDKPAPSESLADSIADLLTNFAHTQEIT